MIAFVLAVFLLLVTPGPGVLSTAGIGAAFGWRQGLFYISGLCIGTNLVGLAVISGVAAIILTDSFLRAVDGSKLSKGAYLFSYQSCKGLNPIMPSLASWIYQLQIIFYGR